MHIDATRQVIAENPFNDPPSAGNRFVMARVRVHNVAGSNLQESSIGEFDFRLTGSNAIVYSPFEHGCGVIPEELALSFFPGGLGEGNVCFEILAGETDLILFYDHLFGFDAEARRWLSLD
jgi:hypothetical protein